MTDQPDIGPDLLADIQRLGGKADYLRAFGRQRRHRAARVADFGADDEHHIRLLRKRIARRETPGELRVLVGKSEIGDVRLAEHRGAKRFGDLHQGFHRAVLRDFAAGKPSRESWEATKRSAMRANYSFEEAWQESIGIFGLLFLLAGILAAAKIPML